MPERNGRKTLQHTKCGKIEEFLSGEYHELHDHKQLTSKQSGFYSENAAVDLSEVEMSTSLGHLALATTADWYIVAQLTTANSEMVNTHNILSEQLRTVLSMIKCLAEAAE